MLLFNIFSILSIRTNSQNSPGMCGLALSSSIPIGVYLYDENPVSFTKSLFSFLSIIYTWLTMYWQSVLIAIIGIVLIVIILIFIIGICIDIYYGYFVKSRNKYNNRYYNQEEKMELIRNSNYGTYS